MQPLQIQKLTKIIFLQICQNIWQNNKNKKLFKQNLQNISSSNVLQFINIIYHTKMREGKKQMLYVDVNGHEYDLPYISNDKIEKVLKVLQKNEYLSKEWVLTVNGCDQKPLIPQSTIETIPKDQTGKRKMWVKKKEESVVAAVKEKVVQNAESLENPKVIARLQQIISKYAQGESTLNSNIEANIQLLDRLLALREDQLTEKSKQLSQKKEENERLKETIDQKELKLQQKEQDCKQLEQLIQIKESQSSNLITTYLLDVKLCKTLKPLIQKQEAKAISSIECLHSFKNMNIDFSGVVKQLIDALDLKKERILMLVEVTNNILAVYSEGIVVDSMPSKGKCKGFLYSYGTGQLFESKGIVSLIKRQGNKFVICNNLSILFSPGNMDYDPHRESSIEGSQNDHRKLIPQNSNSVKALELFIVRLDSQSKSDSNSKMKTLGKSSMIETNQERVPADFNQLTWQI